ncbi:hypothetical protein CLOSTHATH_06063 [Hungatella hathewayi DSM 13479]|uniref:Uncharacterized protein n=1 Tax=Hungatella hathewayi DSM 13479 TaxID=566550 RepID=D3AR07_9FIRM|nr:hypothetical protein CLOSTHATH_06063 [Hungatella hathewayi DSM 13479]
MICNEAGSRLFFFPPVGIINQKECGLISIRSHKKNSEKEQT